MRTKNLGDTARPAVRTGLQAALAEGMLRLLEVVPEPDLAIDAPDRALILVVTAATIAGAMQLTQRWTGLGRTPVYVSQTRDRPLRAGDTL